MLTTNQQATIRDVVQGFFEHGGLSPEDAVLAAIELAGAISRALNESNGKISAPATTFVQDASALGVDISGMPEDVHEFSLILIRDWFMKPLYDKKSRDLWVTECRRLMDACGDFHAEALTEYRKDFVKSMEDNRGQPPFNVSSPRSLIRVVDGKARQMRERQAMPSTQLELFTG